MAKIILAVDDFGYISVDSETFDTYVKDGKTLKQRIKEDKSDSLGWAKYLDKLRKAGVDV